MFNLSIGKKKKPCVLIVLDGWGVAPVWGGNAIAMAEVNNFTELQRKFPYTTLLASDGAVGLPLGAPGNSEAGHLNIGAGKVVHQDQPFIDNEIETGNFFKNPVLIGAVANSKTNKSNFHIMGLLSKTGTHSQIQHLFALLKFLKQNDLTNVCIHLFTDGRDSDSMSGIEMLTEVNANIKEYGVGQIQSLIGRFFAMDRDNRWDRIDKAYNLLINGVGDAYDSAGAIFTNSYAHGVTDEFIEPSIIQNKGQHFTPISDNDSVIFFNFRSDRAKELMRCFLDPHLPEIKNRKMLKNLYFASFVMHDEKTLAKPVFTLGKVEEPIAAIISAAGLRQYHTAETEKYAHVTYFFNGGREDAYKGEDRMLIPSPKVLTYDKKPEMSAELVTKTLMASIKKNVYDFSVVNFANADMVGHTGDLKATIKAVEFVDQCLGKVLNMIMEKGGIAFVCADHGNAEQMVNPKTGSPDTEHTTNPVPFCVVAKDQKISGLKLRSDGVLASITPTILDIMGLPYHKDQKDKSLIL